MDKRDKAIELRKQGTSLGDISNQLGVAKSTASIWCRNVKISRKMQTKLHTEWLRKTQPARLSGAQKNKDKKLISISTAKDLAKTLLNSQKDGRDLLIAGTCLYWAEGSKSMGTSTFLFVNSDPTMVLLIMKMMEQVFKCNREDFVCSIQINETHKSRIHLVLKFWQNMLNLPLSQFRKPSYVATPHKRRYANHDSYFGVMRLSISKGRYLQYCMIELVKAIGPAIMSG